MTPEKKEVRNLRNKERKQRKADSAKAFLQMMGRMVTSTEVPTDEQNEDGTPKTTTVLDFPPYIKTTADGSFIPYRGKPQGHPALAFLGAKTFVQAQGGRKNRPGNSELHSEALIANAEWNRTHVQEVPIDKAGEAAAQ